MIYRIDDDPATSIIPQANVFVTRAQSTFRAVTPDRVMHRGMRLISHRSLAWDDGRWEGQGVWIGEYSSYELADLQLEQTQRVGECGTAVNQGLLAR
jgi:hypothetical protein